MSSRSLEQLFGVRKPVIAMAHIPPLPGTPLYDQAGGVPRMLECVASDLRKLLDAGVDAVMFSNEGDRPYSLQANFEAVAVMTRIVSELAPRDRPFGVDYMWDPKAPLAIALATGASFVREVFTGVYESDMGLWNTDAAAMLRYRHNIGADNVQVFFNIMPEFASFLGARSLGQRARSAAISSIPDVLLVSGMTAGAEPGLSPIKEVKEAVDDIVPVFLNTGANANNICDYLQLADGVIVGSALKVDGYTWNPVDEDRARTFMAAVRQARSR